MLTFLKMEDLDFSDLTDYNASSISQTEIDSCISKIYKYIINEEYIKNAFFSVKEHLMHSIMREM